MRLHQKTVEGTSTLADKPPLHGAALSGSAVEAISNGHGLGVYSLSRARARGSSPTLQGSSPRSWPKRSRKLGTRCVSTKERRRSASRNLATRPQEADDRLRYVSRTQKHPLSSDTPADEASPASASKAAVTTTTAATPPSAPPPATLSVTHKPAPRRKHHKKKVSADRVVAVSSPPVRICKSSRLLDLPANSSRGPPPPTCRALATAPGTSRGPSKLKSSWRKLSSPKSPRSPAVRRTRARRLRLREGRFAWLVGGIRA